MQDENKKPISAAWCEFLKEKGYEQHISKKGDYRKVRNFSRVWRRIFREIKLNPFFRNDLNIFEVGCGGGGQLMMFALNGWKCVGLDCSEEVLKRAGNYIQEASAIRKEDLNITLICEDFLNYKPSGGLKFDVVFHVGVLEHFLDESERLMFLKKMFDLSKPGGYIISIVPSGIHPLRQKMRQFKLGGYNIPEIDYNPSLITKEFKECGAEDIKILPHNILGYFLIDNKNFIINALRRIIYYFFQIIPSSGVPFNFALKHASTLIGIAKKSL
ncbi:MAG: class I SAM-dependent methyltransferase [bacterium]|nr:class I SAM-dependent methyltransferase [bacterium]